jgi:hypothetical protein
MDEASRSLRRTKNEFQQAVKSRLSRRDLCNQSRSCSLPSRFLLPACPQSGGENFFGGGDGTVFDVGSVFLRIDDDNYDYLYRPFGVFAA